MSAIPYDLGELDPDAPRPRGGPVRALGALERLWSSRWLGHYSRLAFRDARVGALIVAPDLTLVHVNASACSLLGRDARELHGRSILEFADPSDPSWQRALSGLHTLARDQAGPGQAIRRLVRADGTVAEVAVTPTHFRRAAGRGPLLLHLHDVTAWRRTERRQAAIAALSRRALQCRDAIALIGDAVRVTCESLDLAGCITTRSLTDGEVRVVAACGGLRDAKAAPGQPTQSAYTLLVGEPVISADLGADTRFSVPPVVLEQGFHQGISVPVPEGAGARHVIVGYLGKDDRPFTGEDTQFLQAVAEIVGAALDRAAAEEELRLRALEDRLTGLANRTLLGNRLEAELRHAEQIGHRVHVIALELDRLNRLVDSLGQEAGDAMLRVTAARLMRFARKEDLLARAGDNEFAIVATRTIGDGSALELARQVAAAAAEPYELGGHTLVMTASVGVAVNEPRELAGAQLLRNAEAAMHHAREQGGARHERFDVTMRDHLRRRLELEHDLRHAVARDELELHYQPLIALADQTIVGFEALIRWNRPGHGLLSPGHFIQIAEESGLIVPIGAWVLTAVCAQLARWPEDVYVSANVSAAQVGSELVDQVAELLQAHAITPHRLVLEITESLVLEPQARPMLDRLRQLGVRVALDDFGTGYSSLGSLHRFPIDFLKLDKALVTSVIDTNGTAIVRAAIELGHALGLQVIGEGIETEQELDALKRLGCPLGQGFRFSKPLPLPGADGLLAQVPA